MSETTETRNGQPQKRNERHEVRSQTNAPQSLAIASAGINNTGDFARLMGALITDVIQRKIPPMVANAAVHAGGKLLRVVEMQMKYRPSTMGDNQKTIPLMTSESDA